MPDTRYDLTRLTFAVLFIAALIGASVWILRPFLPAIIWAATLVIATWPIMLRMQAALWHSRALAVTVMTLVLLLLFVVPFWFAIAVIVRNAGQIVGWAETVASMEFPPPPAWLPGIPMVGAWAARAWQRVGDAGWHELLLQARPYAGIVTQWFIAAVGGFGMVLIQFLLTVAVSAIMYARGEASAAAAIRFGRRLAGDRGEQSVRLAGQAIRGVALGVVVTALVQTAIGGLGLVIAGVPFAPVLSALMFMLCIAQLGPGIVLIPAVVWMYASQDPVLATVLLVCSMVALTLDNFLRPILIRMGADLPLLLILVGVIGGLNAFGLIGIFLGPTILAVAYTLMRAWVAEGEPKEAGAR